MRGIVTPAAWQSVLIQSDTFLHSSAFERWVGEGIESCQIACMASAALARLFCDRFLVWVDGRSQGKLRSSQYIRSSRLIADLSPRGKQCRRCMPTTPSSAISSTGSAGLLKRTSPDARAFRKTSCARPSLDAKRSRTRRVASSSVSHSLFMPAPSRADASTTRRLPRPFPPRTDFYYRRRPRRP